ncbi:MAG TPA: B12-binding domain-containing radical SAM protein, partial [Geobacteraceae bacterium]
MRLTLVAIHTSPSPQAVPLANAFLAAYLASRPELADKVTITLCNCFSGQPPAEAAAAIAATEPDMVGFSLYLWNRAEARQLGQLLLEGAPRLLLFAGGPEATADPHGVLTDAHYRFLVCGEGEQPLAAAITALLAGREPTGIPGVLTRSADQDFSPAPAVSDLDQLPSPILAGLLPAGTYTGFLWQLSRGCSFSCDFCFDAKGGRGVRRFSLERITAELTWFVANRVSQVFVLDATFNQDLKRAKAILRLIRQLAPQIHFHFELRSEFIDRELAELCSEITCSLQIGLQSADPRTLARVQRVFNREDFVSRIGLLNESGAVFGFDLIYGLPGDTLAGFKASLDFATGLYPNHLDIFPLAVLPGTALAERSATLQLDHLSAPPYALRGSPTFPAGDMARARQLANACDIFYSRGKAVAWCNAILAALKLKPSAFFAAFADWLASRPTPISDDNELSDHEIWQ